jgi:carboxypeptidase D
MPTRSTRKSPTDYLVLAALLLAIALLLPAAARGQTPAFPPEPFPFSDRYPAEVIVDSPAALATLDRLAIDVGNVRPAGPRPLPLLAIVYVNNEEVERLAAAGLIATAVPNESLAAFHRYGPGTAGPDAWPTYQQFVTRMQNLADAHPDLVRMISIGQSVQGRDLWLLKISDQPDAEEDEPEFKYSSTMHGNEPIGTEMTLRLAELLVNNYGVDPNLTMLVNEMEIWLCPLHNPDGYVAGSRYNAHGVDLNRNFPDRVTDPVDDPAGRELETQAFMNFGYAHRFTMGANYHTGAQVVNYPWDSVPAKPDYAPDDALFHDFSVGYAIRNPMIWNGGFPEGVTRGWEWYIIRGGMQDWAYHWRGEHHVTIELSNVYYPPYSQMNSYWDANRDAMLWWMGRALTGVRGLVTDAITGAPLDATVDVLQIVKPVRTDPEVGDYHRLLLSGVYTLKASAAGYQDQTATVNVVSGTITVQDFQLVPPYPLAFQPGWNLVALPRVPADPAPAAVLAPITGSYDLVYAYDACDLTDPWKVYDPAAPPWVNDLTQMDVRHGYWLRDTTAVTLTLTGALPGPTSIPLCVGGTSPSGGWNLIGYPSTAAVPLPDALASITGKYDLVYAYDASDPADPWRKYDPLAPPWVNTLTEMGPGRGYWLRMTEAATLTVGAR